MPVEIDDPRNPGLNDVARLVLMDLRETNADWNNPQRSMFGPFVREMREQYADLSLVVAKQVFARYMGFDGRERATCDIDTGHRIFG